LNNVINDLSSGAQGIPSIDSSINIFKRFLEKIRAENFKSAK
jgi:hypothetical protein